jgi:hypothetical protein
MNKPTKIVGMTLGAIGIGGGIVYLLKEAIKYSKAKVPDDWNDIDLDDSDDLDDSTNNIFDDEPKDTGISIEYRNGAVPSFDVSYENTNNYPKCTCPANEGGVCEYYQVCPMNIKSETDIDMPDELFWDNTDSNTEGKQFNDMLDNTDMTTDDVFSGDDWGNSPLSGEYAPTGERYVDSNFIPGTYEGDLFEDVDEVDSNNNDFEDISDDDYSDNNDFENISDDNLSDKDTDKEKALKEFNSNVFDI